MYVVYIIVQLLKLIVYKKYIESAKPSLWKSLIALSMSAKRRGDAPLLWLLATLAAESLDPEL